MRRKAGLTLAKSLTDNSMSGKRTNQAIGSQHQNGMFCTTVSICFWMAECGFICYCHWFHWYSCSRWNGSVELIWRYSTSLQPAHRWSPYQPHCQSPLLPVCQSRLWFQEASSLPKHSKILTTEIAYLHTYVCSWWRLESLLECCMICKCLHSHLLKSNNDWPAQSGDKERSRSILYLLAGVGEDGWQQRWPDSVFQMLELHHQRCLTISGNAGLATQHWYWIACMSV